MKRGQYFTIDAFIAMTIIATSVMVLFGVYQSAPDVDQPLLISQELIDILVETEVNEISNSFIKANIDDGNITKFDNTLLQQTAEFYVFDSTKFNDANLSHHLIANVTSSVPQQFKFEVRIDQGTGPVTIFARGSGLDSSELAISANRVVFGVDEDNNQVWGPVVMEMVVWQ